MVVRVVILSRRGCLAIATASGYQPPGASVVATGRWHCVFAVVAIGLFRKPFFVVSEGTAVLAREEEGASLLDPIQSVSRFGR